MGFGGGARITLIILQMFFFPSPRQLAWAWIPCFGDSLSMVAESHRASGIITWMQIPDRERELSNNENTCADPEKLFRENTNNIFPLVKVSSRNN